MVPLVELGYIMALNVVYFNILHCGSWNIC